VEISKPVGPPQNGEITKCVPLSLRALPLGATGATSSTRSQRQASKQRPDLRVGHPPQRGHPLEKAVWQRNSMPSSWAAAGRNVWASASPQRPIAGRGRAARTGRDQFVESRRCCLAWVRRPSASEIRDRDPLIETICAKLDHFETRQCVTAERAFLEAMGGGCHLAVAGYAKSRAPNFGCAPSPSLAACRGGRARSPLGEATALGRTLAAQLLQRSDAVELEWPRSEVGGRRLEVRGDGPGAPASRGVRRDMTRIARRFSTPDKR